MTKLKLAKDLSLPVDVVTQVIAVLAKRRAGKSYTMRKLVEELHDAGQQIVLVDPKGDQWGLRSGADGKSPGKPILILGGEHGDLPLEAGAGELTARLVVEERVSVLLDLSQFRKNELAHFMTDFLENLYRLKAQEKFRTPMMLVVDEADAIAPQKPQANEARMLGAIEDIVRRGGQRGIGCTLVTQRSAVLNKNVLTQAQMLVVLRTIAPQDIAAMKAWIEVHGTIEQGKTLIESLPSLPVGDAWFWSPGWPTNDGIFQRARVLPIVTFDSGATPAPGQKRVMPKTLADVDIEKLKGLMAETIEKKNANDPKLLKQKIAKLEADLKKLESHRTVPQLEETKQQLLKAAKKELDVLYKDAMEQRDKEVHRLNGIVSGVAKLVNVDYKPVMPTIQVMNVSRVIAPGKTMVARPVTYQRQPEAPSTYEGKLPEGERKVLIALIEHPDGLERQQITVFVDYKRSTRDAYIQRLGEKGLVETRGGKVYATPAGIAALPDYEPLPKGKELQEYYRTRLPEGEWKVLAELIKVYPHDIDRDSLSEITGYKRSTRDAYIQRLSLRQLVDTGLGVVKASDNLF